MSNGRSVSQSSKVRLWAILGEGSTGKSTVVGNLISQTGRGRVSSRRILLDGGGRLELYPRRQSLQEAKRKPDEVVRDTLRLIRRLERGKRISIGYFNTLLAIRTDSINGLPTAKEYLSHFVQAGWAIESIVVLDYVERKHSSYFDFGVPLCPISDASQMARDRSTHHILVGQVRNHFGWG